MNDKKNTKLIRAKAIKNDEFYTLYEDIEKELKNYTDYFENKIIYCNCDNPKFSNFWKYFNDNFTKLKIKKLYATYFDEEESFLYEKTTEGISKTKLKGNGDFRNFECIEVLKKSDIIITNPPFSLLIPFFRILISNNKKFIFISSITTIKQKYFIKEFKSDNLFSGINRVNNFYSPNNENLKAGATWLTNFKINRQLIELTKSFSEITNKTYFENKLLISKLKDTPKDYEDLILVPITYLLKHNKNVFLILGCYAPKTNTKNEFTRILIKRIDKNNIEKELTLF